MRIAGRFFRAEPGRERGGLEIVVVFAQLENCSFDVDRGDAALQQLES